MSERSREGGGSLRAAVSFLTPLPGGAVPGPRSLWWFPVVGAGIGASVGGLWWAAARVWPGSVAALIAVVADLTLTGLLHLDGLCDSADGLLAPLDTPDRLRAMADPGVGAFGAAAAVVAVAARWAAFAALRPAPELIAGLWAASRTQMASTISVVPYARAEGGLASVFLTSRSPWPLLAGGGLGLGMVLVATWRPAAGPLAAFAGPLALTAATAAAVGVVLLASRRLGGFTGDVLGAAGMVGETVGLLVAALRW